MLWSIMLTPPKPISVLEMMVLTFKDMFISDKFKIPRVISIDPFSIEDTTSWCLEVLNTPQITVERNLVICKLFRMSIMIKLKTMYEPTINIDISES